jgi:hypothetical protein
MKTSPEDINPKANRTVIKKLDVVRTKTGVVAVVAGKSGRNVSLAFATNYGGKHAWYAPDELEVIGNVIDMEKELQTLVKELQIG